MQLFSQKYTIISLLEDVSEGYEFKSSNWPLHVTVADTFAYKATMEELQAKLEIFTQSQKQAKTVADHEERFGAQEEVAVTILDANEQLINLHDELLDLLGNAAVFNNPEYTRKGFRPHVTIQPSSRLEIGDTVEVNNLAVIDMFPGQNPYQRTILRIYPLVG